MGEDEILYLTEIFAEKNVVDVCVCMCNEERKFQLNKKRCIFRKKRTTIISFLNNKKIRIIRQTQEKEGGVNQGVKTD